MAIQATTMVQVAANPTRTLVFFPAGDAAADDSVLCFNYKTGQWSSCSAYDGIGMYNVQSKDKDIGLVRFSSGSVDLQDQSTAHPAAVATIETGATDPNKFGRTVVEGVRPLVTTTAGTIQVDVGVQDTLDDSVTYSTGSALNSRTKIANFRAGSNTPEGRYVRAKLTITGGFTTAMGADIDAAASGKV